MSDHICLFDPLATSGRLVWSTVGEAPACEGHASDCLDKGAWSCGKCAESHCKPPASDCWSGTHYQCREWKA
eukprot:Nk52_evm11s278 gene=Nk52_evmTU11s278